MDERVVEFAAMASDCSVRVLGDDPQALRAAAQRAVNEVRRIEAKYSRYRADSVVSRINARAGTGIDTEVDDETEALFDFAGSLYSASGGMFDITSGVLRRAWDFRVPRLPEPEVLQRLVALVGWPRVRRSSQRIALPDAGMEIDFGGFGKEYAADRAASVLIDAGIGHGCVDLGGDLRVVGPRADGSPWHFGIQHPRRRDALLGRVELARGALATSGDYERFIEVDGRRYCHLLDPRSGWPVTHWQAVSVVAPTCAAAGALCTLAMLAGDRALPLMQAQHADFLAVDRLGTLHVGGAWPAVKP